jgi:APA family basic amino acid/polyamine antiporter
MFKKHLEKKSLALILEQVDRKNGLSRKLTLFNLIIFGVGAMIGGGIFVLPGIASYQTGPAVTLSFLIAGILCMSIAFCYAELSSHIPSSGGCYVYAEVCLGKIFGYMTAITLIFVESLSMASVSNGCASYVAGLGSFLNINLGQYFMFYKYNLLPPIIVCLSTLILYRGVTTSAIVNLVLVTVKVLALITFIVIGVLYVNTDNWTPFFKHADSKISSVLDGVSMLVVSYAGFDALCATSQEAVNPRRDIPIAIISTITFCIIIYILVTLVMTGLVPYHSLSGSNPIFIAIQNLPGLRFLKLFILLAAISATFSVTLIVMYGISRWVFSLAKDGTLPKFLGILNSRSEPVFAVLFCGLMISLFSVLLPVAKLIKLANAGFLLIFIIVSFSAFALKNIVRNVTSNKIRVFAVFSILGSSIILFELLKSCFTEFFIFLSVLLLLYLIQYYCTDNISPKIRRIV